MDLSLGLKAKLIPPLSANLISSRYRWLSLELAEPNLGVPPPVDIDPDGTSDVWVLSSDYIGNRGWASYDPLNFPFDSKERPDLETVGDAVDEVIYNDPRVTVFAAKNVGGSTVLNSLYLEIGDSSTWAPATLSWGTAKVNPRAITTYYLNISGTNSTYSQWITGDWQFVSRPHPGFFSTVHLSTSSFSITAEDWAGARGTSNYSISFRAPVLVGVLNTQTPTEAQIVSNANILRQARPNLSFTVNTPTALTNQFYYIAWPVDGYGDLNSTVVRPFGQTGGQPSRGIRTGPYSLNIRDIFIQYILEVSENPQNQRLTITYA